jgi:hypothetical protein
MSMKGLVNIDYMSLLIRALTPYIRLIFARSFAE